MYKRQLKWARANDCPWNENTCKEAACGGHLEVLKWARENGCPWDRYTREIAASKGYGQPSARLSTIEAIREAIHLSRRRERRGAHLDRANHED